MCQARTARMGKAPRKKLSQPDPELTDSTNAAVVEVCILTDVCPDTLNKTPRATAKVEHVVRFHSQQRWRVWAGGSAFKTKVLGKATGL